ncbi:MAG: NADH:ubiquinone reductase (Na(+)-transporting) subunit A [Simkaniaceae bacterium]|nr:MAG: NADH:ubiquinone reductase (Na(+)-transporting) subunit A [Simkaniaceae bacterium]
MKIKIKKGLDIPLPGQPTGKVQSIPFPNRLALDLSPFETTLFKLVKKEGESVRVGEPIAYDKKCPKRLFVSPASGVIKEIVRGLKRRLLSVVIETDQKQISFEGKNETLFEAGLAPHIQVRPGLRIAHPDQKPEAIFVKAVESAPFAPPPEIQVEGHEGFFRAGIKMLKEFAPVHLVCREECGVFSDFDAQVHTASGPHPIGNHSVHIAAIHPITMKNQVIWTLNIVDVIAIGRWKLEGSYHTQRIISVAGDKGGFYQVHSGTPLAGLIEEEGGRIISGDPLTGVEVGTKGYLGFYHHTVCALSEPKTKREFLHFLKLNREGYTASKAYLFRRKIATLSTLMHGEERAFVDGAIYDRVMPLPIETMLLVKMLLTEEYEKGEALGLLGVHPEDFALPTYVCPSKIEMTEIVKEGLKAYALQYLDN